MSAKKPGSKPGKSSTSHGAANTWTGEAAQVDGILRELDEVLTCYRKEKLDLARGLLSHPESYVRLAAAEVLGWMGESGDALLLTEKLLFESGLTSSIGGVEGPWHGRWAFFPTVTVMGDAIGRLGNPAVVPALRQALTLQVEPHAREAVEMAINQLDHL